MFGEAIKRMDADGNDFILKALLRRVLDATDKDQKEVVILVVEPSEASFLFPPSVTINVYSDWTSDNSLHAALEKLVVKTYKLVEEQ